MEKWVIFVLRLLGLPADFRESLRSFRELKVCSASQGQRSYHWSAPSRQHGRV